MNEEIENKRWAFVRASHAALDAQYHLDDAQWILEQALAERKIAKEKYEEVVC